MTGTVARERTRNYLRQIRGAVVYRAVAVLASFLAIPMMIRYLGQEQFGVWSTLLTVLSWALFFDLGIGNGLRNKVAESLARNQTDEARRYIASGYTLIGFIALSIWLLLITGAHYIPWQTVFNTQAIHESELRQTVQIAASFLLLNFWVGLISALLGAIQRTAFIALGQLVSNLLILLFVFLLSSNTEASIASLALVYGLSLVTVNILLSVWFYRRHPELRPRFALDRQHISPLLTLGLQFFVIQLAVLAIFTTDKMLITQLFGPQYVTEYEVVFKIFSLITFAHGLISAPLWSAYTDAYHRQDFVWLRRMLRAQTILFLSILIAIPTIGFLMPIIVQLWIGYDLHVSSTLILSTGIFVLVSTWVNIFATFLNGVQKIRLSLTISAFAMMANIPMSIFLATHTSLGVSAIIFGTIAALLPGVVLGPIQTHKILTSHAEGIWAQ